MSRLAHYLNHLQRFGIKPGLERIEALLTAAGRPERTYPVLLVGGTNGKGSTCEFAAKLLASDGRRIGLYTSPHLYEWNERLRVLPGAKVLFEGSIPDSDLDELFDDAKPLIDEVTRELGQPTEFEVVTFLGLWHFARQKVDAAVVEVGLGGRWDATNTTDPAVSVITHVALDHCDRLGNTVEEIGADKVHIARPGRPLLTGERNPSVLRVFEEYCGRIGANLRIIETPDTADFQAANAALAREAAAELARAAGWVWPPKGGLPKMGGWKVPGRCEIIGENPRIIVDGANNPEGAEVLARQLSEMGLARDETVVVLGILADKDWRAMARALAPLGRKVLVTQSQSVRALGAETLLEFVVGELGLEAELLPTVAGALARARELASPNDTILVSGSFTTIAEVDRAKL